MTDEPKPHLSGWCSPWCSPRSHAQCQDRINKDRLTRFCECPKGHTPRKDDPECQ